MMAAHLRLPEAITDDAKEAYVDSIIQRLGMTKSADTIVGDAKVHSLSARHGLHIKNWLRRSSSCIGGPVSAHQCASSCCLPCLQ